MFDPDFLPSKQNRTVFFKNNVMLIIVDHWHFQSHILMCWFALPIKNQINITLAVALDLNKAN